MGAVAFGIVLSTEANLSPELILKYCGMNSKLLRQVAKFLASPLQAL